MAEAWFLPALIILLPYDEERGGARNGDGREAAGEMGPPKLLLFNGFAALTSAVGLACWPSREKVCRVEPWIEGFFYLELSLLMFLGLGQLFLYVAVAVGVAGRRGLRGLTVALARATGVLVLASISFAANCVF